MRCLRLLHKQRAAAHEQPVPRLELRSMTKDVAPDLLDAFENAQSALDGQTNLPSHAAGQLMYQGCASQHQLAGAFNLEVEQSLPVGVATLLADGGFLDAEPAQVVLWQINTPLGPIDSDVLPEVDELQGGADAIRTAQVLRRSPSGDCV